MAWLSAWGPGSFLHAVQEARLYADSKHFVDMPLKAGRVPGQLLEAWSQLVQRSGSSQAVSKEALQGLVNEYFDGPGSDLVQVVIPVQAQAPAWLEGISDAAARAFGTRVFSLWPILHRKVSDSVLQHPERHSLMPLQRPFIVPGDRFRECYYWDSYWVIRGLLSCGLHATARDITENLLSLVDTVGHVPNGARTYYTNRSQPPLLSAMVMSVAGARSGGPTSATQQVSYDTSVGSTLAASHASSSVDVEFLKAAMPRLVATWRYWFTEPNVVHVQAGTHQSDGQNQKSDAPGRVFVMARYFADLDRPRPESYCEDYELAGSTTPDANAASTLYRELASAAESGWDFSSRWMVQGQVEGQPAASTSCTPDNMQGAAGLCQTRTTQVVPADLNAFLLMTARDVATAAHLIGDRATAQEFDAHAADIQLAINTLMWHEDSGCWHDLLLLEDGGSAKRSPHNQVGVHQVRQLQRPLASNWVPLWAGAALLGSSQAAAAVEGLRRSGLLQSGGVLTSAMDTGQQWDAPNAWPPLQHMIIEGLAHSGVAAGREAADGLARAWLRSNMQALSATGHMHEKYNALEPGTYGGGGEYTPQVGFGWTNGVVLDLLYQGYRP